mmetsp:Transcript_22419/g.73178  ORF Transcript_22419/g.73178 Transcript_22419/m.73178 type:complete len:206 (-) Transcript_22419:176-793(-)
MPPPPPMPPPPMPPPSPAPPPRSSNGRITSPKKDESMRDSTGSRPSISASTSDGAPRPASERPPARALPERHSASARTSFGRKAGQPPAGAAGPRISISVAPRCTKMESSGAWPAAPPIEASLRLMDSPAPEWASADHDTFGYDRMSASSEDSVARDGTVAVAEQRLPLTENLTEERRASTSCSGRPVLRSSRLSCWSISRVAAA